MTLTCKWVKDQMGDLVMKWTGDEVPVMKRNAEARKGIRVRLTTISAPPTRSPAPCSGMAHTRGTGREHEVTLVLNHGNFRIAGYRQPDDQLRRRSQNSTGREEDKVRVSLRGEVGGSLAAHLAALLPGRSCPFVTQSELSELVKTDRSDIERQVRQAEWMMRHPQRGMSATPYLLMHDWRRFLCWIDGVIQHLEQPRPVPELEHLIRTWQDRRANIVAPNLRWRRRADVIAV
jgi:hypothetical protein